jgi:hypothetical protein
VPVIGFLQATLKLSDVPLQSIDSQAYDLMWVPEILSRVFQIF